MFLNPSEGNVTIEITLSQKQSLSIKVIDVLGREVFSSEEGGVSGNFTKQLDLSHLPSGTYFLKVMHDGVSVQGNPYGEMRKMVCLH
ncbi:MAG: T9SS type A sorting domain-containing protein [Chitinophagales bacterium]|nr:T9SS type A sorting domain-containing protein [Chitinophagales bacterium]